MVDQGLGRRGQQTLPSVPLYGATHTQYEAFSGILKRILKQTQISDIGKLAEKPEMSHLQGDSLRCKRRPTSQYSKQH